MTYWQWKVIQALARIVLNLVTARYGSEHFKENKEDIAVLQEALDREQN